MGAFYGLLLSFFFITSSSCSCASEDFSIGEKTEQHSEYFSKEEIFMVLVMTIRDRADVQREILALEQKIGFIVMEKQRTEKAIYEMQHNVSVRDAERYRNALEQVDRTTDIYYYFYRRVYQMELNPLMEAYFNLEYLLMDTENILHFLNDELEFLLMERVKSSKFE